MHKWLFIKIAFVISLFFVFTGLKAQDSQIKPAFAFPTKEVYDLHVDKHGFIWIASDFGVSRYDGISCVHFSHPRQISLGCTNLLEDNYGRIWFNNFNGQIFYIDHEKVTLLESYQYKKERNFPRMAMFHDQLLATSDKGLFVLNTKDLTSKYIGDSTYTSSMAVLKDRVLIHGDRVWYSYNGGTQLNKLTYTGDAEVGGNVYTLNGNTYRDTVYMMVNPIGAVKKLLLQNNTVKQVQQIKFDSFINTLSISAGNQWVNTNSYSYSLKNGEKIKGYNVSAVVTDHEGNTWFSSLFYGLLIEYKKDIASKTIVPSLDGDDIVTSLKSYKGQLLLGTQKGFVLLYDPVLKTTAFKIKASPAAGSINYLAPIDQNNYIIASSIGTYSFNIPIRKITELVNIKTAKQLCYDDKATYVASTSGLFIIPHQPSDEVNRQIVSAFGHAFKYDSLNHDFYVRLRARAIAYFPEQAALFVTLKNSLYKIDKSGIKPFMFDNDQVYAASLAYVDHRLYIGTISNGMLVLDKDGTRHISAQNGLFSKSVFKIKPIDENLWILGSGPLQIFNTKTKALVDNYAFPDRSASEVFDMDGVGKMIYFATTSGLDNFPLVKAAADNRLKNYLLSVKINNQIATDTNGHQLSYSENNVLFNIGIPAYLKARDIYIKYVLATKTDTTWLTTEPGERSIHFSALSPGSYTLKAIAVDPRLGVADSVIRYDFTIAEPWWRGTAFKIALFIVLLLILCYAYAHTLLKRIALRKAFDTQQQLILAERQRISAEMHDDIGSGVFAIQSLAYKAGKSEQAAPEIEEIKAAVNDLSGKIREVIWNTNVANDTLEMLLIYIYLTIGKLFEHTDIEFVSELPDVIPDLKITFQSRRTVYLLVKEIAHNAIKHSHATTVELKIATDDTNLYLAVVDNGAGIDPTKALLKGDGSGMGLGNIKSRVEKLHGTLSIENKNGAHISITIPLRELQLVEFDQKLGKWQLFLTGLLRGKAS